ARLPPRTRTGTGRRRSATRAHDGTCAMVGDRRRSPGAPLCRAGPQAVPSAPIQVPASLREAGLTHRQAGLQTRLLFPLAAQQDVVVAANAVHERDRHSAARVTVL